jgi:anti-sigma B factor antagonist
VISIFGARACFTGGKLRRPRATTPDKPGRKKLFIVESGGFSLESLPMTPENLQVMKSEGTREGQRILHLKGSLNIHTVFSFQEVLRSETTPELIIDFSGVPYIDSAGLGALVAAYVGAQKTARKLAFSGMNTQVKALIDMTHVSKLFKSYPTIKDAEAALS